MSSEGMKKRKATILTKRLRVCVISGTLLGFLDSILFLTDNLVSGNLLGGDGLAGLTLMNPVITFITFVNIIIPLGTTVAIAFAQGNGDAEKADKLFSQGLTVTVMLGVLFSCLLFFTNDLYTGSFSVDESVRRCASDYCTGLYLMPVITFLNTFLYYLHIGEGFETVCVISSVTKVSVNISLDIILCRIWGTFGIGIATTIGLLASLLVKLYPVIRSKLSLRFRPGFELKSFLKSLTDGLMLSADMICPVLFAGVMNITLLAFFDGDALVVFAVILNIENFTMSLYFCLVNSVQSLLCQYHAEKCYVQIRKIMFYVFLRMLLISGILIVLVLAFAGKIAGVFGITGPSVTAEVTKAIYLYTPFIVFLGTGVLLSRYYVCIRHRVFGAFLMLFTSFFMPVLLQLILGLAIGLNGVWAGLGIGYAAVLAVPFLTAVIRKKSPCRLSPVLLFDKESEKRQFVYNVTSTQEEVMDLVNDMDRRLKEIPGLEDRRRNHLVLMAEESCMHLVDRFREEPVDIETSVICPGDPEDTFVLIVRNTGKVNDVTDENAVLSSFREYVFSSMIPVMEKAGIVTKDKESTVVIRC